MKSKYFVSFKINFIAPSWNYQFTEFKDLTPSAREKYINKIIEIAKINKLFFKIEKTKNGFKGYCPIKNNINLLRLIAINHLGIMLKPVIEEEVEIKK